MKRLAGILLLVLAPLTPGSAQAAVSPIAECRVQGGGAGIFDVYYGYVNPGAQASVPFGDQNQVVPGLGYQGQPEVFNSGSYPRVFKAVFNSNAFTSIAWELDGGSGTADLTTPLCASGATGVAGNATTSSADLTGLVDSRSADTAWYFEYGPTIAYGSTTPERHLTSPTPRLVSETVTGLAPGTTYHFRLVSSGTVTTVGEDRSFTTGSAPPAPIPPDPQPVDLAIERTGPGSSRPGRAAAITFTARNSGSTAASAVELVAALPGGMRLRGVPGGCVAGRETRCALGSLPPGGTASVTFRVKPLRSKVFPYSATVAAAEPEARPADNLIAASLRVKQRPPRR